MATVLVTGFEPFENDTVNPSWEAVRALDGLTIAGVGAQATVVTRELPCVFGAALQTLERALLETKPILVLAVGLAGGRPALSVERVAINLDDARIADNAKQQPIDIPVVASGPAAYFSTLPIKAIRHALCAAGIPAAVSQTAGTFVCNHVFYGLMHHLAVHAPTVRGGFIHVPYLPAMAAEHPGAPSMALATMSHGLQIAIATALAVREDRHETGGALH